MRETLPDDPSVKTYAYGITTVLLSMTCLVMTLIYSFDQGDDRNLWGLPVGVDPIVRGAQFLGETSAIRTWTPSGSSPTAHSKQSSLEFSWRTKFLKVRENLREETFLIMHSCSNTSSGLELIASGFGHKFSLDDGSSGIHKRVVFSSVLRLVIGYMFMLSLFINVVQATDVLSVFYNVLALQFVESIDDVSYALGSRGFFGETIRKATSVQHSLQAVGDRGLPSKHCIFRIARFVYYLNAVLMIAGLIAISVGQSKGTYGCATLATLHVNFAEMMWDEGKMQIALNNRYSNKIKAYIVDKNGETVRNPRELMFPFFNGDYKVRKNDAMVSRIRSIIPPQREGLMNGYPRYVGKPSKGWIVMVRH